MLKNEAARPRGDNYLPILYVIQENGTYLERLLATMCINVKQHNDWLREEAAILKRKKRK